MTSTSNKLSQLISSKWKFQVLVHMLAPYCSKWLIVLAVLHGHCSLYINYRNNTQSANRTTSHSLTLSLWSSYWSDAVCLLLSFANLGWNLHNLIVYRQHERIIIMHAHITPIIIARSASDKGVKIYKMETLCTDTSTPARGRSYLLEILGVHFEMVGPRRALTAIICLSL